MRAECLVLLVAVVAACGGPAATPIIIHVTPPPVATSALPSAAPTATASPTSVTVAPSPSSTSGGGVLAVSEPIVVTWLLGGEPLMPANLLEMQVIVPITNRTEEWVLLSDLESEFEVYDRQGAPISYGWLTPSPRVLGPLESGYLLGFEGALHQLSDDFATVRVDIAFAPTTVVPPGLRTANVIAHRTEEGGVLLSGVAFNEADTSVPADYAAVFLGDEDDIIGFQSDDVGDIDGHGSRSFEIHNPWTAGLIRFDEVRGFVSHLSESFPCDATSCPTWQHELVPHTPIR